MIFLLLDSLRYMYMVDCACYSLTIALPNWQSPDEICTSFTYRRCSEYPSFACTSRGPKLHVFNMGPVLIVKYLPIKRSHCVITWHDALLEVLANRRRHCTAFPVKLILFHLSFFAHVRWLIYYVHLISRSRLGLDSQSSIPFFH